MYPRRTRAIIYVPAGVDVERWQKACHKHCLRRGYDIVSLTVDEDGSKWRDVVSMFFNDEAEVVVVFDTHKLPEDRTPRMEEVGVERTGDLPRERRPRLFRRS